jgi:hypothetical protein
MQVNLRWLPALLAACGAPEVPLPDLEPVTVSWGAEVAFACAIPGEPALFGGLDGAAPPGAEVVLQDGGGREIGRTVADPHGRFELRAPAAAGERRTLVVGQEAQVFSVREPASARRAVVRPAIGSAGGVPNDLLILDRVGAPQGVLVRSGDHAVSFLGDGGLADSSGVRLADRSNPWFVAALDARRVAVTNFGRHTVAVIDLDSASVERELTVGPVSLAAPFTLARPIDLDGDGVEEATITRFSPRAPQGIASAGGRLFVAFAGFVAPRSGAEPPVWVPSVLADWDLGDLDAPPRVTVLPAIDAQEVRIDAAGRVVVVQSGAIDFAGGEVRATSPGGLAIYDPAGGRIEEQIPLGDFVPASALAFEGRYWVSSLARAEVIAVGAGGIERRIALNDDPVDSVFRLTALPGGWIGAPSFNGDRLHLIDPRTGMVDPLPFGGPIQIGPGRPIFDGLSLVARRPGRAGVDFQGPDLWALAGVASRITPLELRRVLGP